MELYDWMKNIRKTNVEEEIKNSIITTKEKLNNLTEDRTCFIYSSYLYEELKNKHIPARIISTKDLGYDYEHRFVLVSNEIEEDNYYLIDLTFSQFLQKNEKNPLFLSLLENGYQEINNDLWTFYIEYVTGNQNEIPFSLDKIFYQDLNQESKERK